mmetsp:Transcript_10832/g.23484  ORF Transcript_10832/g.23484 Transcript_10832/m.23484 type:complete len:288 (-) Transcript_10832:2872-3735(-)
MAAQPLWPPHAAMDSLPDAVLRNVLSFVPSKAFLPTCHVSKTFRRVWLGEDVLVTADDGDGDDRKLPAVVSVDMPVDDEIGSLDSVIRSSTGNQRGEEDSNRNTATEAAGLRAVWACDGAGSDSFRRGTNNTKKGTIVTTTSPRDKRLTSPLQIGNLFACQWNKPARRALNTALLQYYVENGWIEDGSCRMKRVMTGAAARGDIDGMEYIFDHGFYEQTDVDICTVAAAAGQLDALKWLREARNHPWDPTEVHRESSENLHDDVMDYVEKNSQGHQIQLSYGVGLPW